MYDSEVGTVTIALARATGAVVVVVVVVTTGVLSVVTVVVSLTVVSAAKAGKLNMAKAAKAMSIEPLFKRLLFIFCPPMRHRVVGENHDGRTSSRFHIFKLLLTHLLYVTFLEMDLHKCAFASYYGSHLIDILFAKKTCVQRRPKCL
jgi:hypothetical protein